MDNNSKTEQPKNRSLGSFLLNESATFADFAKQRQSVDLEKLFFGQDGAGAGDGDDDGNDGDDEKKKKNTVENDKKDIKKTEKGDKKGEAKEGKVVTMKKDGAELKRPRAKKGKDDSSGRKSSDTSSGVADLSPSHPPSPPQGDGSQKDSRRVSQGLHARQRFSFQAGGPGGKDREGGPEGHGTASRQGHRKSKNQQDKRVKTALRRLLNERLFGGGSSNKKKSRRGDDVIADNWTNANSVANNVSETSSSVATRAGTRQTGRPVTQGKVAFAEVDPNGRDARGSQKRNDLSPTRRFKPHDHLHADEDDNDDDEDKNGQERLPTRGGSRLPPLRTPTMALERVFTPANFPKWGLCVTASQRSMLVDGLQRDRTFLSRMQAQSAWSSKADDSMILPPHSRDTGKGEEDTDDDSYLHPHRPDADDAEEKENGEGDTWAHRRAPPPGGSDSNSGSVAFTKSSGRSPLDMDDRRLRLLLEELYKDKKFMDKLINKIDKDHLEFPDHMASDDIKFLSEFGRQYLLDRAQYWELHGPLGPPRPPPTALGLRMNRAQTSMTSEAFPSVSSDDTMTSPRPKTVR